MGIHVVQYQPEIPANTGNIARTCVGTNATLHLIHPLSFSIDDKQVKRAGLDYWKDTKVVEHNSLEDFLEYSKDGEIFLITKFGEHYYDQLNYSDPDKDYYFIFGRETTGLPVEFREANKDRAMRIPMTEGIRSLNVSNTAAILIYEALRQQGFPNMR
ncbi:tRNA (uridine(34)/cytosine(34)/5-carboxymethylaminomethyluridine(34)-2'-O)-methyltransferase TrmL [Mangrovibacillus cuniculi]|uniref:Putative tRNA (cytidine(34)-2'-O)-methyltransferase n=1 Tax=Mangrovibacillus cuniculi TaxID=2593652 RepID=A0A7S8HEJ9_9BACI|nr:tRNA (uridine(34)/cytosine(34)/5-carboxymethylaminomethyluridine(34)-2'-O)-methyltransferase TrmL [Mangrovibacillus cuniculi]QPC45818.1 tRNA (uridine(34)/cytosine(34)/5-carboxymethylaminomethyluridine(34)-2'-O)-methyltransferase TrmL [Mangrovibacillus cuniculi]